MLQRTLHNAFAYFSFLFLSLTYKLIGLMTIIYQYLKYLVKSCSDNNQIKILIELFLDSLIYGFDFTSVVFWLLAELTEAVA